MLLLQLFGNLCEGNTSAKPGSLPEVPEMPSWWHHSYKANGWLILSRFLIPPLSSGCCIVFTLSNSIWRIHNSWNILQPEVWHRVFLLQPSDECKHSVLQFCWDAQSGSCPSLSGRIFTTLFSSSDAETKRYTQLIGTLAMITIQIVCCAYQSDASCITPRPFRSHPLHVLFDIPFSSTLGSAKMQMNRHTGVWT